MMSDATTPAKGVIYARVSTEGQRKVGYSIPSQIKRLEEKMKADRVEPVCSAIIDAESGRGFDRKGFDKLLKLASQGSIQYLYVYDLDRLGRNVAETPYLMYRLKMEFGVVTRTIQEEFNFVEPLDFVIAVLRAYPGAVESRQLGERTRRGKMEKFHSGKWVGPIPLGYTRNVDGELTIARDLQPILTEIFHTYEKTGSFKETTEYANKKYSDKIGILSVHQIRTVITNPVYCGRPRYGDAENCSPKLSMIPTDVFDKLQLGIRSKNRKLKAARVKEPSVLDDLFKKHGIQQFLRVLDLFAPFCPRDQSRMVSNGTKSLKKRGLEVPKFICQKCGFERHMPSDSECNHFPKESLSCPKCRTLENIDTIEKLDGLTDYACKNCGTIFTLRSYGLITHDGKHRRQHLRLSKTVRSNISKHTKNATRSQAIKDLKTQSFLS